MSTENSEKEHLLGLGVPETMYDAYSRAKQTRRALYLLELQLTGRSDWTNPQGLTYPVTAIITYFEVQMSQIIANGVKK